jgi:hypothetical protein
MATEEGHENCARNYSNFKDIGRPKSLPHLDLFVGFQLPNSSIKSIRFIAFFPVIFPAYQRLSPPRTA